MSPPRILFGGLVLALTFLSACTKDGLIPESIEHEVDETVTFSSLSESPETFLGRILILGGEVLSATRTREGTRIEVLQLPLDDDYEPGTDRMASQGRFLAVQSTFLDPATLPEGTRLTIVGAVSGSITLPLDETDYTYPTLTIKNLKVWRELQAYPPYWGGPYWGPYGHPYWGPYWRRGPYPYWYWW